ncbi:MAG: NADH-quinone oxidoreductase subunit K [Thiobacillaceae bacterium]|nr:NADH-quinone oxidoreductase subunit K [Thiobacillaceae bacterium]
MILALYLAIAATVAAGVYLALSRDLFRCVVGLAVLGGGVNLLLFAAGRLGPLAPPVMAAGEPALAAGAANPLPQALVLTAIVIGFALLAFSLVLAARLVKAAVFEDSDRLRATEPPPKDAVKPEVLD